MEHRRVEVAPYTFWETRAGQGPPVVLIHGLAGSARWWARNIPSIARDHEVAAIDLIGFGRNRLFHKATPLPLGFDDLVVLLGRYIEKTFEGRPVHLIGHSMGGHIAIRVAAARPDLIRSLVLVNSTGVPFAISVKDHLENLVHPNPGLLSFSTVLATDVLRAGPTSVAVASARLFLDDATEAMSRIAAPTLVVWGEHDPLVPLRYGREIEQRIRSARLVVLPKAGHVSMWDEPEGFNVAVGEFLQSVESGGEPWQAEPVFSWGLWDVVDGVAFRQSGRDPQVVLVHGLGVWSSYFRPLAGALYARGIRCIAPDVPGFGFSDSLGVKPDSDSEILSRWGRQRGLLDALWVGHSTGCQVVERIGVERTVHLSPIWTAARHPIMRFVPRMIADGFLENWPLLAEVTKAYWHAGLIRFFKAAMHYARDATRRPDLNERVQIIAGQDDPLIDWRYLHELAPGRVTSLPGAHGFHFSQAEAVAERIAGLAGR